MTYYYLLVLLRAIIEYRNKRFILSCICCIVREMTAFIDNNYNKLPDISFYFLNV